MENGFNEEKFSQVKNGIHFALIVQFVFLLVWILIGSFESQLFGFWFPFEVMAFVIGFRSSTLNLDHPKAETFLIAYIVVLIFGIISNTLHIYSMSLSGDRHLVYTMLFSTFILILIFIKLYLFFRIIIKKN